MCGIVANTRGMFGQNFTGYPALVFYEMVNYGRGTQSHLEKMVILEKWYSHLRAYLPAMYDKKKQLTEYNEKIAPCMIDAYDQIECMNEQYDPAFEGIQTCKPEEKNFCKIMRGVYERLDAITAKAGIISGQHLDDDMEAIG